MRIRIRSKLAAALAVPLVALVAITALQATEANAESDRIEEEAELAFVALGPGSVTTALQNERNWHSLDLIGLAGATELDVDSSEGAIAASDAAIESLRGSIDGLTPTVREAFGPAFEALDDLQEIRATYTGYEGERGLGNSDLANEVFTAYTRVVEAFFDATSTVATQVDEAALRNGVEIVDAASRRSETIASATRNVVLDSLTGGDDEELRTGAIGLIERIRTLDGRIKQLSTGPYADVSTETYARPATAEFMALFDAYAAGETIDFIELLDLVGTPEGVQSISERATAVLGQQSNDLSGDAFEQVRFFTLLAAGVIALAIVITYVATTSITRPLRKLRDEADDMAGRRLPDAVRSILETPLGEDVVLPEVTPIAVQTRDEVNEVVAALNKVQERTLALAVDQAVLRRNIADSFVNLGRRNQNLLDRQLEFITELEQVETEPDQLEALFRLDHLATRMRRNAESLLVLAGTESPRTWGAPVEVDAVVRLNTSTTAVDQTITVGGRTVVVRFGAAEVATAANSPFWQVSLASAEFNLGDFVVITGNVSIGSDGTFAGSGLEIFMGRGPARTSDGEINPLAVGVLLTDARIGLVQTGNGYAVVATGTVRLLGIDGLTLVGTADVAVNTTGVAVDHSLSVPGGDPVAVRFATGARVTTLTASARLGLLGQELAGTFSFDRTADDGTLRIAASGVSSSICARTRACSAGSNPPGIAAISPTSCPCRCSF